MRCLLLLSIAAMLAACGTRQVLPEPQPHESQVVVELHGEAREGVTGPKRRTVRQNYATTMVSIEDGANYERVDYGRIDDVVVLLNVARNGARGTEAPAGSGTSADSARITAQGFDRQQLLVRPGDTVRFTNGTKEPVFIYGFNEDDVFFEVEVAPGAEGSVKPGRGIYEVFCEQHEHATLRLFVHELGWIGDSDRHAFFPDVAPTEYEVRVYAPRLPAWTGRVSAAPGTRAVANAELTVNTLPRR